MPETKATAALNKTIANATVMAQKIRQYHWYVGGVNFYDLHAEFGKLYDALADDVDTWAERVRQLGDYPISTLQSVLSQSDIKESPEGKPASDASMVAEVINDLSVLLESIDAIAASALPSDRCSAFIADESAGKYHKARWMLNAFATGGTKLESKQPVPRASRLIEDIVGGADPKRLVRG